MSQNTKNNDINKATPDKVSKDLSYEEAFDRLKGIVDKMQQENISLNEIIKLYKEGKLLSEHCNNLLEEAKFEIENILKDKNENSK